MSLKNFPGFRPAQTSILRTVDEPKMKKKFNWDRVFFILILGVLVYLGVRRIYRATAQIEADGQIVMGKVAANFTDDIRIKHLLVEEGDPVRQGDSLFNYVLEMSNDNAFVSTYNKYDGNNNWYLRERLSLNRQIQVKENEASGLRELISLKNKDLEELRKRVYLGAEVSHKIDPVESDILELENQLDDLRREIKVLQSHLRLLASQEDAARREENLRIQNELSGRENFTKITFFYTAPIDGMVGLMEKEPNEVCYQGETVLTIHQLTNLRIKAFFDAKFASHISTGDEVEVEFEGGSTSRGVIENFYASTYPLPPEFQKRYEPVTRTLVADVVPLDTAEAKNWSVFYKMGVKVKKKRFGWF